MEAISKQLSHSLVPPHKPVLRKIVRYLIEAAVLVAIIFVGIWVFSELAPAPKESSLADCLESYSGECAELFMNTNLIGECTKLPEHYSDTCSLRAAETQWNPQYCDNIMDEDSKNECFWLFVPRDPTLRGAMELR